MTRASKTKIDISDDKVKVFRNYLINQGFDELPLTSPYEVLRFNSSKGVMILYKGARGYSGNNNLIVSVYHSYKLGCNVSEHLRGKPVRRAGGGQIKKQLRMRDGDRCFYCGMEMPEDDMTREHLIPVVRGGKDSLENQVLAHGQCNKLAGTLPLIEKLALRDRMRAKRSVKRLIERLKGKPAPNAEEPKPKPKSKPTPPEFMPGRPSYADHQENIKEYLIYSSNTPPQPFPMETSAPSS